MRLVYPRQEVLLGTPYQAAQCRCRAFEASTFLYEPSIVLRSKSGYTIGVSGGFLSVTEFSLKLLAPSCDFSLLCCRTVDIAQQFSGKAINAIVSRRWGSRFIVPYP